jgi:hypothetical protein
VSTSSGPPEPPSGPVWRPAAPYGQAPSSTPPGGYPDRYGPQPDALPPSSGSDRIVFTIVATLAGIALGFVTGFVWDKVADPPQALVTDHGVFLTGEPSYNAQVVVTLSYLVVGFVGGVISCFVLGIVGRRHGPAVVVAVVLLCAAATGIGAWSGKHVFGPDLKSQVAAAKPGDVVTTGLSISSDVAYLGWPIGGLLGAVIGITLWPTDRKTQIPEAISSNVVGPSPTRWGS